jgi:hypothetical protein
MPSATAWTRESYWESNMCTFANHTGRYTRKPPSSLLHAPRRRTQVQLIQPCHVPRLHQLWLHQLYFNLAVHREYLSPGRTGPTSTASCAATSRLPTASTLHQLRCESRLVVSRPQRLYLNYAASESGCLGSSRGSSPTTSHTPRDRVSRHVARLVAPLVVDYPASRRLVVDYTASRRLVVDYFASAARPSASAHRAARRAARRRLLRLAQARRRLLHLYRASGCLGTSLGSSRGSSRPSSSTTSPPPRVRVPRHVARLVTRLVAPLVVDYFASRRLVVNYFASAARLGASARRAAVTRLVAWLVAPLVVDYFASAACPGASTLRAARHAARRAARRRLLRLAQARRRLLRLRRASGCLGTSRGPSRG